MAKKQKAAKKSKLTKKKMDISAIAMVDNIVFSKTERWAYYRLSNSVYDFLSNDAKISMGIQIMNAFSNLMGERQEELDCHLIVTTSPVDIDAWESQVQYVTESWDRSPSFESYIREQAEMLRQRAYTQKVTYLGVNLGKRGAFDLDTTSALESGIQGAWAILNEWLNTMLQTPSDEIDAQEEADTKRIEEDFYRTLSTGNLSAERATAEELLLLIKRQFYPTMTSPYLDVDHGNRVGPGDLELELCSAIENKLRWLKINQMVEDEEQEGYRACLTVSKLPHQTHFPYNLPFMYLLNSIGIPFTVYSRFSLVPTTKVNKELEKRRKEAADEVKNFTEGMGSTLTGAVSGMPADMQQALQDMHLLQEMLNGNKAPWVKGNYRIVVETPDDEKLRKWCSIVKQRFSDQDINISWTVGDQKELFLEQMPGDRLRDDSHYHMTDLQMFGTSGFVYASDVGDLIYEEEGDPNA